ncbi:MAG: hypothetical protein M1823_008609, partial [Watsoniomyces obsoletus]
MRQSAGNTHSYTASTSNTPVKPSSSKFGYDERGLPTILDEASDVQATPIGTEADGLLAETSARQAPDPEVEESDLESLDDADGEGELMKIAPSFRVPNFAVKAQDQPSTLDEPK